LFIFLLLLLEIQFYNFKSLIKFFYKFDYSFITNYKNNFNESFTGKEEIIKNSQDNIIKNNISINQNLYKS